VSDDFVAICKYKVVYIFVVVFFCLFDQVFRIFFVDVSVQIVVSFLILFLLDCYFQLLVFSFSFS